MENHVGMLDCCRHNKFCNIFEVLGEKDTTIETFPVSAHGGSHNHTHRLYPQSQRSPYPYNYDYDFELERGKEYFSYISNPTIPIFLGYCYFCDCSKHSQNYCPIRYCHFCKSYGHSIRVCPKNSVYGNDNWRHNTQRNDALRYVAFSHFKYWRKTPRHHHPVPFGSTWKNNKFNLSSAREWRRECTQPFAVAFDTSYTSDTPGEETSCGVLLDFESSVC